MTEYVYTKYQSDFLKLPTLYRYVKGMRNGKVIYKDVRFYNRHGLVWERVGYNIKELVTPHEVEISEEELERLLVLTELER